MSNNLSKFGTYELIQLKLQYKKYIKYIDTELNKRWQGETPDHIEVISTKNNNERLQHYLESTCIKDINFLHENLNFSTGNNRRGPLGREELLLINKEANDVAKHYGITNSFELSNIFWRDRSHPLFKNQIIRELYQKVQKLSYLDEVFRDQKNCMNYQGSYITFQYVKSYLEGVLVEDNLQLDADLVYRNYKKKIEIVTENLIPIAQQLLLSRDSIPGARIAVCNNSLTRIANKKPSSLITYRQKMFIEAIAFGTTLEKLQSENYKDAKQLIYLPYKK